MTPTRSSTIRIPGLLLIAFLAVVIVLTQSRAQQSVAKPVPAADGTWANTRAGQLVFFAVLEGLYRDGVSNTDVDLIIPPGPDGNPKYDQEHFVYACPLCHPAFEAFRLYRQRERIFGLKKNVNTFGPGLDAAISARLRSDDAAKRREAIEDLIRRWVAQRLEIMRLSDTEREAVTREMERGRKEGMNFLEKFSNEAADKARTNCPICDGGFGACKLPVQ